MQTVKDFILSAVKNETSPRSRIRQNAGYLSFPRILANAATAYWDQH